MHPTTKKPSLFQRVHYIFLSKKILQNAIFHIVIFQKIKKREKRKEKRHSSMVCESWWAPDGIG
jgi:hypothetical protein